MKKSQLIGILSLALFVTSCGLFKFHSANYLPKEYENIQWEMNPEDVAAFHNIELAHDRSFRKVYVEQFALSEDLENVIYYFGVNEQYEGNPLYEVILNFKSAELRNEYADDVLGDVHFNENDRDEWRFQKDEAQFAAWTFQNKLVIVKRVAGTEWDREDIWAR